MKLLASNGKRAAVGQFSVGVPDVTTPSIIEAFYPAIDAAIAARGVFSLHEYSSPLLSSCYSGSNASGSGWTTGRYRKWYQDFLVPTGRGSIPLVITEGGIDADCGSPLIHGWQKACGGVWDGLQVAPVGNCAQQFMNQLIWYDTVLKADDFVVGVTLFCYHCFGFDTYEMEPMLPALTSYMKS